MRTLSLNKTRRLFPIYVLVCFSPDVPVPSDRLQTAARVYILTLISARPAEPTSVIFFVQSSRVLSVYLSDRVSRRIPVRSTRFYRPWQDQRVFARLIANECLFVSGYSLAPMGNLNEPKTTFFPSKKFNKLNCNTDNGNVPFPGPAMPRILPFTIRPACVCR